MALNQYAQDERFYPQVNFSACANYKCGAWADKIFPYLKSEKVFECPSAPQGLYRSGCPASDMTDPSHPISYNGAYDLNIPERQSEKPARVLFGVLTVHQKCPASGAKPKCPPGHGYLTPQKQHANRENCTFQTVSDAESPRDSVTGIIHLGYDLGKRTSPHQYTRPSSTKIVFDGDGGFVSPGYQNPPAPDTTTLTSYGVDTPHEGGAHVCFADGHVKWMSLDSLLKRSLWRLNGPE